MSNIHEKIEHKLLEILSFDHKKTAEHLAEELKVEQPDLYQQIMDYFTKQYGLGGCGAQMSPRTAVQQTLAQLQKRGLIQSSQTNGTILWHKV